MKNLVPFILIVFISVPLFSQQNKKDSLINVYRTSSTDTVKILALKDLSFLLARNSPDEAKKYCHECIELSEEADYPQGIIRCSNIMGIINIYEADFASAIENFNFSLRKAEEENDQLAIFRVYNNLGNVYINLSDYNEVVKYFTKALSIAEKLDDKRSIAQCYINIAIVHKDNRDYTKAMEYNEKGIELCRLLEDELMMSQIFGNISNIKKLQGDIFSAIDFGKKALAIQKELDDSYGTGISYINLGEYYLDLYRSDSSYQVSKKLILDSAEYYYNEALAIGTALNDDLRICNSKNGLADICRYRHDYTCAYTLYHEVIELSERAGIIETTMLTYKALSDMDVELGNYRHAFENFVTYKDYSDSIYTEENRNSINEMEVKYQTEKKQKEIEILNREKALESFKNKILFAGVIVLIILSGITLVAFIIKRRDNRLLRFKNGIIRKQKEEIQTQADYLAEANHEITIQKEQIERSHLKITDSITYAKRIQSAVMPDHEHISELLPGHFILFKPRDIVSGDFYFVKKVDDQIYIAVADCTGHGVPGAFMSMLGITILNDLVKNHDIKGPAQLLEALRLQVKSALGQTGKTGEQQEGMDIALCILNPVTKELGFSGAYNPLWLFRRKKNHTDEPEIIELQGDRQPVGVYIKEKPFTEHRIKLLPGDIFYIFSDGFYSQFGGKKSEKLKIKRFQQMLVDIQEFPVNEQKKVLEQKYDEWKGSEIQIDDVLVMGIQI